MNYKDVALVNSSFNQLGDSLLQNRMLEMRAKENAANDVTRQKQLDLETERVNLEKARGNAAEQHYRTMEGHDTTRMSQQDQRDKAALLQTVIGLNAGGQIDDLDSVNEWLANDEHFGPTGIQLKAPPAKPTPQAGQNALAQAYRQADMFRQQAGESDDPDLADRYNTYADNLEKWANLQANPPEKKEPGVRKTVTTKGRGGESTTYTGPADQVDAAAGQAATGQVRMIDRQGVRVLVPAAQKSQMLGKGYTLDQ